MSTSQVSRAIDKTKTTYAKQEKRRMDVDVDTDTSTGYLRSRSAFTIVLQPAAYRPVAHNLKQQRRDPQPQQQQQPL